MRRRHDDEGIRHIWGLPFELFILGDINGEGYLRTNSNKDTATGNFAYGPSIVS